jgi:hypothetical protein
MNVSLYLYTDHASFSSFFALCKYHRNPRDSSPLCNVLRKGFINKVGCAIDIYFAPTNMEGEPSMECEKFTSHLGPIDDFLAAKNQNLDVHNSPLKFENTYNGHSFVARMSHDQSFVARIEIDHDSVNNTGTTQEQLRHQITVLHLKFYVALMLSITLFWYVGQSFKTY